MTKIIDSVGYGAAITQAIHDANWDSVCGINEAAAGTTYTVDINDQNRTIELTNAGTKTVTLTALATILGSLHTSDFKVTLINVGAGLATINRSSTDTFNGGGTSITLVTGESVTLQSDSTQAIWNRLAPPVSGAQPNITALGGLTTALTVAEGGTGLTTLTANNVYLGNGTSAPTAVAPGTSGNVLTSNGTTWASTAQQGVAQVVRLGTITYSTLSTTPQIPVDDTIPQNTEGEEILSKAFTPTNASSVLYIDVIANIGAVSANVYRVLGLFVDSTAAAVSAAAEFGDNNSTPYQVHLKYAVAAGSTSARTYKVRAGSSDGGAVYINGNGSGRLFGGVLESSITITEILP